MTTSAAPTRAELIEIRDEIVADLHDIVAGLEAAHPAELERAAAVLLMLFEDPEAPAPVVAAYVEGFESLGDEPRSAGLLGAFSMLARERFAARARAVLDALGAAHTPGVGGLRLAEARLTRGGGAEVVLALLEREGDPLTQVAGFAIQGDGWLGDGFLTPPAERAEAEPLLEADVGFEPLTGAGLLAILRSALERSALAGLEIPFEAAAALPIVARALTGDPAALPRLAAGTPAHPLDVDRDDGERLHELIAGLLDDFGKTVLAELDEHSPLARAGPFVCESLLEWKGGCADGRLGHWTCDDLREYLLHHFPREVIADGETIAAAPDAVAAFVHHLDGEGLLIGEPADHLAELCAELRPELERLARDRGNRRATDDSRGAARHPSRHSGRSVRRTTQVARRRNRRR